MSERKNQTLSNRRNNALGNQMIPDVGQGLFLLAYAVCLANRMMGTTLFPSSEIVNRLCTVITLVLILCKIALYDKYTIKGIFSAGVLILTGILSYMFSTNIDVFIWCVLLLGAKGIPLDRVLKTYVVVAVFVMSVAFAASMAGVIENRIYIIEGRRLRYAFGINYTTDFAAHCCFIFMAIAFLLRKKWNLLLSIISSVCVVVIFYYTDARADCLCMMLLILGFSFFSYKKYNCRRYLIKPNIPIEDINTGWFFPLFGSGMIIISVIYNEKYYVLSKINGWISGRLKWGRIGFDDYSIKPFGQYIRMVGMGPDNIAPSDYFFLDCSYVNILLRYGGIFFIILLSVYVMIGKRYKGNLYMQVLLFVIAANCIIAHHLIETAYNPFGMALLASMGIKHRAIT